MWARMFWRDFNQYSVSITEAQFWAYLLSAKGIEINRERKCALSTIILGVKLPLQGSTHCSCIINILLIMNYTWVSPQKIRSFPNKKSKNTLQDFDHQPFTLKKNNKKEHTKKNIISTYLDNNQSPRLVPFAVAELFNRTARVAPLLLGQVFQKTATL